MDIKFFAWQADQRRAAAQKKDAGRHKAAVSDAPPRKDSSQGTSSPRFAGNTTPETDALREAILTVSQFNQPELAHTLLEGMFHAKQERSANDESGKPDSVSLVTGPAASGKTVTLKQIGDTLGRDVVTADLSRIYSKEELVGFPVGMGQKSPFVRSVKLAMDQAKAEGRPKPIIVLDGLDKVPPSLEKGSVGQAISQILDEGITTGKLEKISLKGCDVVLTATGRPLDLVNKLDSSITAKAPIVHCLT